MTSRTVLTEATALQLLPMVEQGDPRATGQLLRAVVNGDIPPKVQELLVTGAVEKGARAVELNHASTIIAATIADASDHQGMFVVKNTSSGGTAAHTLTLTSGTFNGTNNIATLNAPGEALVVYFAGDGDGIVLANVGSVALSGP